MSLNEPLTAVFFDSFSNDISGFRVCHPAVQNIDSFGRSIADQLNALFFRMTFQPFSTEADFTHLKICLSQSACFHYRFPPLYAIRHALQHSIDASIYALLFNVDMFDTYGKYICVYYILVLKEYWKSSVFVKMSVKNSYKIDF